MFYRFKNKIRRTWFDYRCRGVLLTRPIDIQDSNIRIVSQLSHSDLTMYLLAIKSVYMQLGRGRVVILDDSSLTANDRATVLYHVPGADIVNIKDVATDNCPRGGCWERLLLIADIVRDYYVIQMDSDTLTLNSIPEVGN